MIIPLRVGTQCSGTLCADPLRFHPGRWHHLQPPELHHRHPTMALIDSTVWPSTILVFPWQSLSIVCCGPHCYLTVILLVPHRQPYHWHVVPCRGHRVQHRLVVLRQPSSAACRVVLVIVSRWPSLLSSIDPRRTHRLVISYRQLRVHCQLIVSRWHLKDCHRHPRVLRRLVISHQRHENRCCLIISRWRHEDHRHLSSMVQRLSSPGYLSSMAWRSLSPHRLLFTTWRSSSPRRLSSTVWKSLLPHQSSSSLCLQPATALINPCLPTIVFVGNLPWPSSSFHNEPRHSTSALDITKFVIEPSSLVDNVVYSSSQLSDSSNSQSFSSSLSRNTWCPSLLLLHIQT